MSIADAIGRHMRIALQFSGGKDSLAVLLLLRPFWDRLTVYWLNSGDAFPETVALMGLVRDTVSSFVEVAGRQPAVLSGMGWPTDVVPAVSTPFGVAADGSARQSLIDRYTCCYHSLMLPMHERMVADGVTLVIRGQKNLDAVKAPTRSGHVLNGIEFLYPIEGWSDEQVFRFLSEQDATLTPQYDEGMPSSLDCMHCTGWLEHRSSGYLASRHPEVHQEVNRRLRQIRISIAPVIRALNHTIEGDQR